ncbi:MAG: UTRA domain-containing protein [Pseudomonadota bacterium]|nr:UTRA domain-containing protein [Pseudomonadota bacterium]
MRTERETGRTLCWTEIYIRPEFEGPLKFIGNDDRPVYRIVQEDFDEKIQKVELELSACTLGGKRVIYLDIDEGAPALRVIRHYTSADGCVVEVSISDHPEDRHTFRLEFSCETLGS